MEEIMGKFLFIGSLVALYGSIGVFLIGRFVLSVIQFLKRNGGKDL